MMRYLCAVSVLALAILTGNALEAQVRAGALRGVVRDNDGERLPQAQVVVDGGARGMMTDADGAFVLRGLSAGEHRVTVSLIGYSPLTKSISIPVTEGETEVEFVLQRTVLSLPGVQVTATPLTGQVSAVTQATTQLSGRSLEREMSGTVASVLKFQPGIAERSMGPGASAPVIRGLTGDRILMLQDGQRAGDLAGSADDHGVTIDPLSAQRMEVVRGPATLLYGNNALGGVVNVISGDVPRHVSTSTEWTLSARTESAMPGGSAAMRVNVPVADEWAISVRAGGRSTEDVRIPYDPKLGDRLMNTSSRSHNGSIGVGHISDRVVAGGAVKAYDFAYGLPVPPGSDPVDLAGRRFEASARAEVDLGSSRFPMMRVDASAQDYAHDELDEDGVAQQEFALDTRTMNLLLRQGTVGPFSEGAWGVSALFKRYTATGPAALTPAADSRGLAIFGFQEISLGDDAAALQLGARFDDYQITSHDSEKFGPGHDRSYGVLSGSVGVRAPVTSSVSAGLNLSRSFRAPTVEELFSGAAHAGTGSVEFGDPSLRAERGFAVEATAQLQNRRWNGQLAVFRNAISNYVYLAARGDTIIGGTTMPVFDYAQDDATLQGVEASIEWAARDELLLGATGDLIIAEHRDGTPLSYMPPARLGALIRWDNGDRFIGGHVVHSFRQERVGAADEFPTEAHTALRLTAGVRFVRGGATHSITVRGENLTNSLHREATSRIKDFAPAPGRNVSLMYRIYF